MIGSMFCSIYSDRVVQNRSQSRVETSIRSLLFCLMIGAVLAGSSANAADTKAADTKAAGSRRTTINFEDQLVEGQTQKPELFYLLQQRNNNFKRLIRLRENFIPEMRKSSEDVGRAAGGKGSDD